MTTKAQDLASLAGSASDIKSDLMFEYDAEASSGLTFAYKDGRVSYNINTGGGADKVTIVPAGTVTLPTSTGTNYVCIDAADQTVFAVDSSDTASTPTINNSLNRINLFKVVTSEGEVTSVTRLASFFNEALSRIPPRPVRLDGCDISVNGTNDIDITEGYLDNFQTPARTKQTDATWVEGDNAGGMNSTDHPVSADTRYWVFGLGGVAKNFGELGFDSNIFGSNLLADASAEGYSSSVTLIGGLRTDASANVQSAWKYDPDASKVLIDVFDVSSVSSVTVAGGVSDVFDSYLIEIQDLVAATDAVDLRVRMGTVSVGSTGYNWEAVYLSGGTTTDSTNTSDSRIRILGADTIGNDAGGSVSGTILAHGAASASLFTNLSWDLHYYDINARAGRGYGAAHRAVAESTGVFELSFEKSGSQVASCMSSGRIKLYGIK